MALKMTGVSFRKKGTTTIYSPDGIIWYFDQAYKHKVNWKLTTS